MNPLRIMKPRHVLWREDYRARRYARLLQRPELNKRIRDIFRNLLILTPEGKIGLPPVDQEMDMWLQKWTHVLEEMRLRYGPYPSGFDKDVLAPEPLPNFASELGKRAARRMHDLGLQKDSVFIKFGKRAYMEALFREGALRIQPASYFGSTDHNGAVRDDELNVGFSFSLTREEIIKLVINPKDVPQNAADQRIDVVFSAQKDYLLYCVTMSIEPRLFVDFEADACVIIHDQAAFSDRLNRCANIALGALPFRKGRATYLDPLLPNSDPPFVPFAKYFGYSYQKEYRYCWFPDTPDKLEYRDIKIGPLTDIATLLTM